MSFLNLFFILFSTFAIAAPRPDVAVVEKVRGTVTLLTPGQMIARKVSEGDKLKEESSILTGRGSFVKIRFIDNSVMSLGPESKAVIVHIDPKDPSVISLLKGKIRANVPPNAEGKEKFYVKTRTAAMGVRGTEFQTLYNPENRITNLLTYSGEVAIVKTDDHQMLEVEKEYVRNQKGSLEVNEYVSVGNRLEHEDLAKALKNNDTVVVKSGQFSGSMDGLTKVTSPVIVSPVQVNALFKNEEFLQKKDSKIKSTDLDSTASNQLLLKPAPQSAPPEGLIDLKNNIYAPKAGGVIDLETGIYVPPGKEAIFDPVNNVFVDSKIGVIDRHTGQYEPPQGLKLDAIKGFMIDQAEAKKINDKSALVAMASELNKNMAADVVLTSQTNTQLTDFRRYSQSELVAKDSLEFIFMPYSQELSVTNDTRLGSDRTFKTTSASMYQLVWGMAGFRFTRPLFELTIKREEFDPIELSGITQGSRDMMGMGLRLDYAKSERSRHTLRFSLMQEFFLDHPGTTTITDELKRVSVPRVSYTYYWNALVSGAFSVNTRIGLSSNLPRESGTFKVERGLGFHFGLEGSYWLNKRWRGASGYTFFTETHEISNTSFTSENKRTSNGINISISRIF